MLVVMTLLLTAAPQVEGPSALWPTLIGAAVGAAGAIVAGLIAAAYQGRRSQAIARAIRREERQEGALLRLEEVLLLASEKLHALAGKGALVRNVDSLKGKSVLEGIQTMWEETAPTILDQGTRETFRHGWIPELADALDPQQLPADETWQPTLRKRLQEGARAADTLLAATRRALRG
jgi:hypothetical protein